MTHESKYFLLGTFLGFVFGLWFIYFLIRYVIDRREEEKKVIRLHFEFVRRERDNKEYYEMVECRPFPADILPAMLIFVCQEISKLDLPPDNSVKMVAQAALKGLGL